MDSPEYFAVALGGIFVFFGLLSLRHKIARFLRPTFLYLTQKAWTRRSGPWTYWKVLFPVIYIVANSFCIAFRATSIQTAGSRASRISLINMIPLFAGSYFGPLVDLLQVSLGTCQSIHRTLAVVVLLSVGFHTITIVINRDSFSFQNEQSSWGYVAGSSILVLSVMPALRSFFPSIWYEPYLRAHQLFALILVISIWQHLAVKVITGSLYVYIITGLFALFFSIQICYLGYRNFRIGAGLPKANISTVDDAVIVRLRLSRPLKVDAGQYIGLYIPKIALSQVHPFVITSWSEEKQDSLDLLIEPQKGFTRKLFQYGKNNPNATVRMALFTGPHGVSAPVSDYETVLMVATGFGIVAQLPYLKKLIHEYKTCKCRTRRVRIIWQLESKDLGQTIQPLLNSILAGDSIEDSYILSISIYINSAKLEPVAFGRRAKVHWGSADFEEIVKEESNGIHIERSYDEAPKESKVLALVSGSTQLRDTFRVLGNKYSRKNVRLYELDYQAENRPYSSCIQPYPLDPGEASQERLEGKKRYLQASRTIQAIYTKVWRSMSSAKVVEKGGSSHEKGEIH